MDAQEEVVKKASTFGCTQCGAELTYKPGTTQLKCSYCGAVNEIPVLSEPIDELDFESYLDTAVGQAEVVSVQMVKCEGCGATSSVDPKIESSFCAYCGSPLIQKNAKTENVLRPQALLPFKLELPEAKKNFSDWINKLWFAPSALTKGALNFDRFKGVYLPFWTYDASTHSPYSGQRGEYYYVDESYTVVENGQTVSKVRSVKNTQWYNVSGDIDQDFDDVLVCSSKSIPQEYVDQLEPWDLENLAPFDEKYLSGFITEKYQVDLKDGFGMARKEMEETIAGLIREDIGGDEQRVHSSRTDYSNITFKYILLPAYISAFKYKGKVYRFLVNARTGEVQGERPWSVGKIVMTIIGGIAIVALLYKMFA